MIFLAFLTPVYYDLFSNLAVPLAKFGWNSSFLVSDVLMAPIFMVTGLLFAFQFAPLLVVELFENDMTPLLLTMPIRRSSIFFVSSLNTLLMTSFGIAMTLSISLAYLLLNRDQLLWGALGICLWIFFLIALGFLFGFLLARLIGKTAAKRTSQLISFLVLILVVMSPSVVAPISGTNPETVLRSLQNSAGFFPLARMAPLLVYVRRERTTGVFIPFIGDHNGLVRLCFGLCEYAEFFPRSKES